MVCLAPLCAILTQGHCPRHLLRILSPRLTAPPAFTDVLLADILTSFAKVLGDAWLTTCFLWPRKNHHVWWNGRGSLMVPILAS